MAQPKLLRSKTLHIYLIRQAGCLPEILNALADATSEDKIEIFSLALAKIVPEGVDWGGVGRGDLLPHFLGWFGEQRYEIEPAIAEAIAECARSRRSCLNGVRNRKRHLLKDIGLDWDDQQREIFIASLPVLRADPLLKPYPSPGEWIVETRAIDNRWRWHLEHGPLPDSRKKRSPMARLNINNLKHIIAADQSAVVRAGNGDLVMVVIRNFCGSPGLLEFLDKVIHRATKSRKSIRLEDPGKLVQLGYSAGARSRPSFHWVRNLLGKRSSDQEEMLNRESSHVLSLAWMLFRKKLPSEVISGFDDFLNRTGIVRMNQEAIEKCAGTKGDIVIDVAGDHFTLAGAELAPPAAIMAANYARAVHTEFQPHKFAISWTISRTLSNSDGGHFYNSSHGICVKGAADTVVAWLPRDYHGTSLQNYDPQSKILSEIYQTGLAFVTSNRLPGVWAKYRDHILSAAEAHLEYFEQSDEIDENDAAGIN